MDPMICRGSAPDKGPFRTVQCVEFATDEGSAECRKQSLSGIHIAQSDGGARCGRWTGGLGTDLL